MTAISSINPSIKAVEYSLGGWRALFNWSLFIYAVVCVVTPSQSIAILHWPIAAALIAMLPLIEILQNSAWSPFYKGPTLRLGPDGIHGRGCLGQEPWYVPWSEVEKADWGRNGIFVYRKGTEPWQKPCRQSGPFNCSIKSIVKTINNVAKACA
jgi:hypothetical protein